MVLEEIKRVSNGSNDESGPSRERQTEEGVGTLEE